MGPDVRRGCADDLANDGVVRIRLVLDHRRPDPGRNEGTAMNNDELRLLETIQQRVLWLATQMIEHANHGRDNHDGLKIGGHQASCASLVTMMTALYLHHLRADDMVAVKPHASPVLHAIMYLLGRRTVAEIQGLRSFGQLQAYPCRTKDRDVDFSTGSVGLGPAATLFAATTRAYVSTHFGQRPDARFFALVGDAELDEGNIWEAVHDPASKELGSVTWLIDFNRQSLDRIVPDMRISPWHGAFEAHGWDVVELKYGTALRSFVEDRDGGALLAHIDAMPNERYQSLFSLAGQQLRDRFLMGADPAVHRLLADRNDDEFRRLVTDLGGHDMAGVIAALAAADPQRPTAIFAYTHKGWGLPLQGNARNHGAVLTSDQVEALREELGIAAQYRWARFPEDSPEGRFLARRAQELSRVPREAASRPVIPKELGLRSGRHSSTQEAFGRALTELGRHDSVAPYLVTTSPDVATSTNLAGWINKAGVFSPDERPTWSDDPMLHWLESPRGQHLELGISEMNLFLLLGQLGLSEAYTGQRLLPIGTLYDPFVCRGLDALIYVLYSGASFIVAGTPSGITLAPEGGAHQSTVTASLGVELPGLDYHEPAYATALEWLLCDALRAVADSDDQHSQAAYFRLSTRTVNQQPFTDALNRLGKEQLHSQVLQGAYPLLSLEGGLRVTLAGCGAVMPEVLAAAQELAEEGVGVDVIDLPRPGRLYQLWRLENLKAIHSARSPQLPEALAWFPRRPLVTIQDASSHHLAWLGGALGVPSVSLGVDQFGQSGTIGELYRHYDLDSGAIVNAALGLVL